MAEYWNGKICLNGHVVDYGNGEKDSFCSKCGSQVLDSCTHCNTKIRGASKHWSAMVGSAVSYFDAKPENMKVPFYCRNCSEPYEWTNRILESSVSLISMDENVDESIKELIKSAIPDLLVETPETPVAIAKYKMYIPKINKTVSDSLYQLLIDFMAETAKRALFPDS